MWRKQGPPKKSPNSICIKDFEPSDEVDEAIAKVVKPQRNWARLLVKNGRIGVYFSSTALNSIGHYTILRLSLVDRSNFAFAI